MPHLWHVEPPLQSERRPFDSALRRKRGSRLDLSHPETSCDRVWNNVRCSLTSSSIDQSINSILGLYLQILKSKVVAMIAQFSASNAGEGVAVLFRRYRGLAQCCYAAIRGTIPDIRNQFLNTVGRDAPTSAERRNLISESQRDDREIACDTASPEAAVMLHLRSCYVSKAAILTVSALPVPAQNRSPA